MAVKSGNKRLSREESRQQTRQRLLAAAAVVIPREGYQAASVESISAEAGYSRGAFYSNFADKDELFAVLLQQLADADHQQLEAIFDQGDSAEDIRLKLREYFAYTSRGQEQFVLYAEAKIHALRDASFRNYIVELERTTYTRITELLDRYARQYGSDERDLSHAAIAIGLVALPVGLTFAQMLDPEHIDDHKASTVLMAFFDAVFDNAV